MERCTILLTRSMLDVDLQYMRDKLDQSVKGRYEIVAPESFDEEGICKHVADADVLLGPYVTKTILNKATKLKLIQVPWTGMDTFNFSAVVDCDTPVCNTHSNADSVAELGVALVLDLLKKVSYHDRKMRNGNWNREQRPLDLKSKMLSKQTACILGCGSIGYRIARLLKAFGARIYAVSGRRVADNVIDKTFPHNEMENALLEADVVICTLPLTEATRGLINKSMLEKFKPGSILVNMSRAGIVNEDDLYRCLESGALGGFASDVWWNAPKRGESESYPSTHNAFWEMDNVIMSPHRAGFVEGCLPHLDGAVDNIVNLIKGNLVQNVVDIRKQF